MNKKTIPIIVVVIVLIVSVTLAVSTAVAKKPLTNQEMVIWDLSKTEVIDPGTVVEMQEGIFVQGIILEGKAKSKGGNVIPEGKFHLQMDAFSPYENMEGQKAGFWYVNGKWTITKNNADPAELKIKHNPSTAEGALIAELPFNPATGVGNWTGKAVLQMALAAGQWSRGEGTLTFRENLEGDLFLPLERWPESK